MASPGRAVAVGAAAAAVLALVPILWPALRGEVPGHPGSDLADHVQGAWWWGGEVLAGRWPREARGVLHPDGGVLWYPDPLGALLALPFRPLGPFVAYTVALAVQAVANALSGVWLGRKLGGTPTAAFVCGCVTGSSAYFVGLVHSGLSEYAGIWPFALLAGALVDRAEGRGRHALVAVAVALATVQSFYYGAFAALLGVCFVAPGGGIDVVTRARRVLPGVALGLVAVAPLLALAWATLSHPDAVIDRAGAPGWVQPVAPGTDLLTFVVPFDRYHPDTPALGNPGILHVNHLGLLALGLAAYGFLDPRARPFRWAALVWAVLALGPTLVLGGEPIRVAGFAVPLPGGVLWLPGSPFAFVHHPYRMVAATLPLLGLLAGIGADAIRRGAGAVLGLVVVAEAWLASPAPFPLVGTDPRPPAVYAELPPGAVLDLPPDLRGPNRWYVWWHLGHGRPVPYGVNAWIAPSFREDPEAWALIEPFASPERLRNRDVPATRDPRRPIVDHGGLAGLGVGAVVLHPDHLEERDAALVDHVLDRLGEPELRDGRLVWRPDTEP